jgi:uridine kinase
MRVTGFTKQNKAFILGVAGGSGSGKTYFAKALQENLGKSHCEVIMQDHFYFDQSEKFDRDGGAVNFDHPSSIDFKLLAECLEKLKQGQKTEIPIYDFSEHRRLRQTVTVKPKSIVIVDGILILHATQVRRLFDEMIFFDTPEEVRFDRRLKRDVEERGRTPQGVKEQFEKHVKPMHDQFVEPSKKFAQTIVSEMEDVEKVLRLTLRRLADFLR